jgi:hypothetical protein
MSLSLYVAPVAATTLIWLWRRPWRTPAGGEAPDPPSLVAVSTKVGLSSLSISPSPAHTRADWTRRGRGLRSRQVPFDEGLD